MSERIRRAAPLLAARQRALDEKRGALAAATRAANAARAALSEAREVWESQAIRVCAARPATVAEHAEARAHVDSLWKAAQRAADAAAEATSRERAAREVVLQAERELKKIETWRDGLLEAEREAAARGERRAMDELAARTHDASKP